MGTFPPKRLLARWAGTLYGLLLPKTSLFQRRLSPASAKRMKDGCQLIWRRWTRSAWAPDRSASGVTSFPSCEPFPCHPGIFAPRKYPGPSDHEFWVPDKCWRIFRDDTVSMFLYCSRMRDHVYFVYILASKRNGTLYTGMTNNLERRMWEHKNGYVKGFTDKYRVKTLVWFEHHLDVHSAIAREKRIKRWRRAWKRALIEAQNPNWNDLTPSFSDAA